MLTSSKLLEALDLSRETDKVRARYGDGKPYKFQYDGAPTVNDQLLMARRLVEAGVRVVTLSYGRWDSHGKNFDLVRDHGAKLDQGLTRPGRRPGSARHARRRDGDRLGRVRPDAAHQQGRRPRPLAAGQLRLLAGGGMKTGQVIGSTNRLGEYAKDRPVQFGEIFATLYHNLGIDPCDHDHQRPHRPAATRD